MYEKLFLSKAKRNYRTQFSKSISSVMHKLLKAIYHFPYHFRPLHLSIMHVCFTEFD